MVKPMKVYIDQYMATRSYQKMPHVDDGEQWEADPDDEATQKEFDEFKLWLDSTTAASSAPHDASVKAEPCSTSATVASMAPPSVPRKCECVEKPCILVGFHSFMLNIRPHQNHKFGLDPMTVARSSSVWFNSGACTTTQVSMIGLTCWSKWSRPRSEFSKQTCAILRCTQKPTEIAREKLALHTYVHCRVCVIVCGHIKWN